jgi:DNA-binding NtrC family response regulator
VMDGLALGRQLRLAQPALPLILTTGNSGSMTAARAVEMGCQALLIKPATTQVLGETVARVLRGVAARPPGSAPALALG